MDINTTKRQRLEAAGWEVTTVADFLGLTPEENAVVESKLALAAMLRHRRQEAKMSQVALAERIQTSQSRVAKMEAGDSHTTIDLLFRAILATGTSLADIGRVIGDPSSLLASSPIVMRSVVDEA